jgi:hypothetical protein
MRAILPLIFLLAACAPTRDGGGTSDPPPDDTLPLISFGWSFGECWGECRGTLWVEPNGEVSFESRGWDEQIFTVTTGIAHDSTLESIGAAYDALDRPSLQATYGCPDCADGGAEWARFDDDIDPEETTWEWGDPPAPLVDLRAALRTLADALQTCSDGAGYDQETCEISGDNEVDPEPVPPPG